jgi:hypothetical protein
MHFAGTSMREGTRECQEGVEALSDYASRGLRIYHIQREEFLPSA